ncbi:MAG: ribosome recycling factor [Planctomycetota bacterium]|jgi:ribosome recycling factor
MPVDDTLLDAEERMEKAVELFTDSLRGIRTGSASAGLVESIRVDYYGSPTPLRQLAQIAIPAPQLIVIKPYDPSSLSEIEKAIQTSDIGINPQNDGKVIRLAVPGLSEERRRQLVARVKSLAEEARVAVRNIRRDANRQLDRQEKDSAISEDDCRRAKGDVQELTDQYEGEIEAALERKTEELMEH